MAHSLALIGFALGGSPVGIQAGLRINHTLQEGCLAEFANSFWGVRDARLTKIGINTHPFQHI